MIKSNRIFFFVFFKRFLSTSSRQGPFGPEVGNKLETPGRILLQRRDRGCAGPRCFRRPRGRPCPEIHALHRGVLPRQA